MELIGDVARKTGSREHLAVEIEKAQCAARIGERTGLFFVPGVIRSDLDAGWVEFERIPGLAEVRDLLKDRHPAVTPLVLEQIGRSLAVIHEGLVLDSSMKHSLDEGWGESLGEEVFIYGDFTVNNVCFDVDQKRLVILDWSAAPVIGRRPTFGTRYFDLFWFAFDLYMAPAARELAW